MEEGQLDGPTSGVQEVLVPERVVDALPTMYCFETCPFCFKVKAILGSRGIEYSKVEVDPLSRPSLSGLTGAKYQFSSMSMEPK